MLAARLDTAAVYLKDHTDVVCVISGGQGENEQTSETQVMRNYLIHSGINASRIYTEPHSFNTAENIGFFKQVLDQNGLSQQPVVIATDRFHQLRAAMLAEKSGFSTAPLSCLSVWCLAPGHWARKILALGRTIILGLNLILYIYSFFF